MLQLDPKFQQLMESLKNVNSIEELANVDMNLSPINPLKNANNVNRIKVAPSILSANFMNLEHDIKSIVECGCDMIHIDVMDGHFVPNMTFGPCVLEGLRNITDIQLDIHLMVKNASFFIDIYKDLKPKYISVHIEEEKHLHRVVQKIRQLGISPAIALNPHTSIESLKYIIEEIDMVLIMSVNPGFGNQSFIESSMQKIYDLKLFINKYNPRCLIEVDGGVNSENIILLKDVGVNIVVSGNYIFKSQNRKEAIRSLQI